MGGIYGKNSRKNRCHWNTGFWRSDSERLYVDKTDFIREWWESGDSVTLITRPRRFGKTLNMSMLEHFFSLDYAGQGELFEGLAIWEHDEYRRLQGEYPVISLSFANIKEREFRTARKKSVSFCQIFM